MGKKLEEYIQPHPDANKPGFGPDGAPHGFWQEKRKNSKY